MSDLSTISTLESVTLVDTAVTDNGLMALRLPRLNDLFPVNCGVSEAAAQAYPGATGTQGVRVHLIQEFGDD